MDINTWRTCSTCKKPIQLNALYWTCNVSTCNRKRTGLVFCSVSCWDAHVPLMSHREAWALENRAPKEKGLEPEPEKENDSMSDGDKEVLVVASKLKNYIKQKSGMNTSSAVVDVISDRIRELTDQAIESAKSDGRKTVMDRDFGGGDSVSN